MNKEYKYLLFDVLLFTNFLSFYLSLYDGFLPVIYGATILNLAYLYLRSEYKIKYFKKFILFYCALLFILIYSRNTEYIMLINFSFLLAYEPIHKTINKLLIYSIVLFSLFLIIRFPEYKEYIRGDGSIRYDLGFNNPNILSKFVFSISILLVIVDLKKSAIFLSLIFGYITDTRTLIIVMLSVPIILFSLKIFGNKNVVKKIIALSFPILTILSVLIALHSRDYTEINKLLSYRPENWLVYIQEYGLPLLGGGVKSIGEYVLDNSFIQIIMNLGIVGSFIISLLYFWLINTLLNKGFYNITLAILLTLIYSLFENMLKYPMFNIATVVGLVYVIQSNFTNISYYKIKLRLI